MGEERSKSRQGALLFTAALILAALAIVELIKGGQNDQAGTEDVIGFVVLSAISIGVAALLFLRVLPRAHRRSDAGVYLPRLALGLGVAALVSLVVYWSGLPFALGAAAATVAFEARRGASSERLKTTSALALGAVAVFGGLVAAVVA